MQSSDFNNRKEVLEYLQSMLGQLRTMAEAERFDMLAYLIEMSYVEATDILRGGRPARIGQQEHVSGGSGSAQTSHTHLAIRR